MTWNFLSLSNNTAAAPQSASRTQEPVPSSATEVKTSSAATIIKAPYQALKYAVNCPLISFPKEGDLKSLALGSALVTGIGAALIQKRIPLNSGLGLGGATVGLLLTVNIIRGLAIPLFITSAGAAAFSCKNPEAAKQYASRSFEWVQSHISSLSNSPIEHSEIVPTAAETAAAKVAEAQAAVKLAQEAAERAQEVAKAAQTVEAQQAAQAAIDAAEQAAQSADATTAAADVITAAEASAQKGMMHTVYSNMALGLGISMHFAGTGASLIGEGRAAAGLEALKGNYPENELSYIRLALKLMPVALAVIVGSAVARSTGLGIVYVALPAITTSAMRTLDWYSGSTELSEASQSVKTSTLKAIQIKAKEATEDMTEGREPVYDSTKAVALMVQGTALDTLGNVSSMLGLGLVQSHGGFLWSLSTSLIGRVVMVKAVSDGYTNGNTSLFEISASYGHDLFKKAKEAGKKLQEAYKLRKEATA